MQIFVLTHIYTYKHTHIQAKKYICIHKIHLPTYKYVNTDTHLYTYIYT